MKKKAARFEHIVGFAQEIQKDRTWVFRALRNENPEYLEMYAEYLEARISRIEAAKKRIETAQRRTPIGANCPA